MGRWREGGEKRRGAEMKEPEAGGRGQPARRLGDAMTQGCQEALITTRVRTSHEVQLELQLPRGGCPAQTR